MSNANSGRYYPDVDPQPSFPKIEERILQQWKENGTFSKSIEQRPAGANGSNEFVFYDGPPFANGLPHYGHLLTGYVKDLIPRYKTMRGKRVERRFGWDCHGLPAEMEAEKELNVSGRKAIEEYGVERFNEQCRRSVLKYTHEWESYVTRQARWVDFENDYKTMDLSYMESVIWAFKALWDRGLIYEGNRVMPYSWACQTPLSNFEIRMDNAYRSKQDPAVTVAFQLKAKTGEEVAPKLLVWTTTPWTLPSNLAIAVGRDIEYAVLDQNGERYIIGAAVLGKYERELGDATLVETVRGADLVGRAYAPLFPYFADHPGAFRVLPGDFVSTEEGTGAVHMAPGFGEDDQKVCEEHGIELVCPVDEAGCFTAEIADYAGLQVFEANKEIIKSLKERGILLRHETYDHNYPHCWRTDTPIIYRALSSWYVKVTDFRERMIAVNKEINWIPDHIRDGQFGRWLENARDWSISRNRFWGAPIPIWKSDDPKYPRVDVYGSLAELERDFGVKVTDLHRPFIDQLVRPNPDDPTGKSMMRRVPEVLDCWFESGSMPFAQVHYPFENKDWFEKHFPADFIVEYIAQTRGWFYTMVVLSTALFDRPPFKNCICHGVVLDENGLKLSKRLRNYPDPEEVCNTIGADALRWFLVSSPILRGLDLQIDRDGRGIKEIVRTVINPIWNAYYFFTLYANSDGIRAEQRTDSQALLDRYILAKCRELVDGVTESLDNYDLASAAAKVLSFLDALTNWYIRRSRDRFWKSEKDQDKVDAYNTLYAVLVTLSKVTAPYLPLITEEIYQGLTGEESVHLADWPERSFLPENSRLVNEMDRVRAVCSAGLSLREAHSLRTRLPLNRLVVAGANSGDLRPYEALMKDELNVKSIEFHEEISEFAEFQLKIDSRKVGPRLGKGMQACIAASKSGDWEMFADGGARVGGVELTAGEFILELKPKSESDASQALPDNKAVVVLDTTVTPELEEEGVARDLVRLIQQARRDAGFHVADHIELELELSAELKSIVAKHQEYISGETLADRVQFSLEEAGRFMQAATLGSEKIKLGLRVVKQ